MKLSKSINWLLVLILFSSQFFSQRINLVLVLSIFIYLLIKNKCRMKFGMPGFHIYLLLLFLGIAIGLVNCFSNNTQIYVMVKQIYYFIMVYLYWIIGSCQTKINRNVIMSSIVWFSSLYCLYDLFQIITHIRELTTLDINTFRMSIGTGSTLSIIAIYFLVFYQESILFGKRKQNIMLILCAFSVLLHFSRTSIISLIILFIFSGKIHISSKGIKNVLIFCILLAVVYVVMPDMMNSFTQKIANSFTELNFNNNIWDATTITQIWRGYEVYSALKQYSNYGTISKFIGKGFGTTINVNGYAYLVTNDDYLCFLHNGYVTQLLIWGIMGLALFIIWISSFVKGAHYFDKKDKNFILGMVVVIMVSTYFIMGPFFSASIAVEFYIISLFYVVNKREKIENNELKTKVQML